jgi:hypothetical protein
MKLFRKLKFKYLYMKNILRTLVKLLNQRPHVSQIQIRRCLIQTPFYACIPIFFVFVIFAIPSDRTSIKIFEIIYEMFLLTLYIPLIYFILVFLPTYLVQILLQKYKALDFVSIITYTIFFTLIVSSLIMSLSTSKIILIPMKAFLILCFFSLTFAVINWVLLIRTTKREKICSHPKLSN